MHVKMTFLFSLTYLLNLLVTKPLKSKQPGQRGLRSGGWRPYLGPYKRLTTYLPTDLQWVPWIVKPPPPLPVRAHRILDEPSTLSLRFHLLTFGLDLNGSDKSPTSDSPRTLTSFLSVTQLRPSESPTPIVGCPPRTQNRCKGRGTQMQPPETQ